MTRNTEHIGFFRRACRTLAGLGLAAVALLGLAPETSAQLDTVRITSGLSRPLFVVAPPGDYNRIFVLEQFSGTTGRIRIVNIPGNTLNATPYLSIAPVAAGNEQGLLGLAFHPNFLQNGYFWVYYTLGNGSANVVVRYQANAPFATSTTANAASAVQVLSMADPFTNHNGGWMAFAPGDTDGLMYIATGDGGSANDPNGNAQNINALLGKMLRIDIDGADNIPGNDDDDGVIGMTLPPFTSPASNPYAGAIPGLDQIYDIGLRNPWRNGFDRLNGNLYIGDVGQNLIEEIDMQLPNTPGINYGWRCMEGLSCTGLTGCTCNAPTLRNPIQTYSHSGGACSITGGYVYRGCTIPSLQGTYFYADYCSNQIFSFVYTGNGTTPAPAPTNRTAELAPVGFSITSITSFGEDALGEIYICDQGGEIFKIVPSTIVDCNANMRADACDIVINPALDSDSDGIIDSCETSACCVGIVCQQITQAACTAAGGVWQGMNRSCTEPNICPPPPPTGACCVGTVCSIGTQAACTGSGGTYQGDNSACGKGTCLPPPVCPCDWNQDGTLTSQDFFDFVAAFFGGTADYNNDGTTTSQDFFDFLACFFQPPPGCA